MGRAADSESVSRTFALLRRELVEDLGRVALLRACKARSPEIEELQEDLERQLKRVRSAAVITLVGSTGAGKSTLLNALVGETIAQQGEDRPTTHVPVIYRPRDADLRELLLGLPGEAPRVIDYDPQASGPWSDQILIDAPDTNSVATLHRDVVRELADRSDVLVVVAHRQSVSELSSVAFVDQFAGRRGLLFVLNRADELTDEARSELLEQLNVIVAERYLVPDAPVLAVSALAARTEPTAPSFSELCRRLSELVQGGVLGRVRRHNAIGTAARLGALFEEVRGTLASDFEGLDASVAAGIESWCTTVDAEMDARLALRRANLRALLWNETAKRWDGPGGLALRAGGISALGLGAGAVIARRNPLLAAGAAAGALATDKARQILRQRELNDPASLLPGPSELERWYRRELGQARLFAAQLTEDPTALGVPAGDELAQRAVDAVTEAWQKLLEKDLLAAADRAAPWYLRMPIDLPVYALCAWVVWSAVRGFFQGEYVGLDLLVNAALILGAWLFLARTFVRALLAGRAQSLLKATRQRARRALADAAAELAREGRVEAEATRRALERLAGSAAHWRDSITG